MAASYGDRLRTRRELAGLSQRALADRSGVRQPLISALEAGRRQPTDSTRTRLEDALRLRPSVALARAREAVLAAVQRHGGLEARVFGSAAAGGDDVDSDLDLLVRFESGRDIADLLALEEELEEILTLPVDVVSAGSTGAVATPAMREAVRL